MNLKKKKLIIVASLFTSMLTVVSGQNYDLNFQGRLADVEGNSIGNEPFDLTVQVKPESGNEVLYEFSSLTTTDENGWFGFTISGVTRFLSENGRFTNPVVVKLDLTPNENTKWLRKNEDFVVTYTLTPKSDQMGNEFAITRMEGTELEEHVDDAGKFFAFKDLAPFAFLSGGFLVTQESAMDQENTVSDLKQWISPNDQGSDEPASRGVKGGFPAGGYYKKN